MIYGLVPNWQHFWVIDALNGEGSIPWTYVAYVGLYSLLYLTGILCVGLFLFRQGEITR